MWIWNRSGQKRLHPFLFGLGIAQTSSMASHLGQGCRTRFSPIVTLQLLNGHIQYRRNLVKPPIG